MHKQNRFALLDKNVSSATVSKSASKKNQRKFKPQLPKQLPPAIVEQRRLCNKFNYHYRVVHNGNVENNTTLYVSTGVAHPHQVEAIFNDVIKKAQNMPEVFGEDFECDVQVNLVRKHTGQYMAYAFVDISNPLLYYALIGCNTDGTDRVEYIPDPTWSAPSFNHEPTKSFSWADYEDEDDWCEKESPGAPQIRKELPALLTLDEYTYDEQQRSYLKTEETKGNVSISPAFITPGVNEDYDDCKLYVSEVPGEDYNFLQAIFARYARTSSYRENDHFYYPKIQIRKNLNGDKYYAIVQYAHSYDTAFALMMLQKIRAKYNGNDINMRVRYAFNNRNRH